MRKSIEKPNVATNDDEANLMDRLNRSLNGTEGDGTGGDFKRFTQIFNDAIDDVAPPADRGQSNGERAPKPPKPELSKKGIALRIFLGALAVGTAGGLVSCGSFVYGALTTPKELFSVNGHVIESGKANVVDVSTDFHPITIVDSEIESDVPAGYTKKFLGASWTAERVEFNSISTLLTQLNADKIKYSYDPMEETLTIFIPEDGALTNSIDILTTDSTVVDSSGNLIELVPKIWSEINDAIKGSAQDLGMGKVELPIVKDIADGTLNSETGLEKFVKLYTVTQVDKECTPLILRIPNLEPRLKENIRIVAIEKLFSPSSDLYEEFPDLMALPPEVRKEIADNATVVLPEGYKDKVAPDQGKRDDLQKYLDDEVFALDKSKPIVCAVDENVKLPPLEDKPADDKKGSK